MTYSHHDCGILNYCLSDKINTDFCIVHAMLGCKFKNGFIHHCTIL